MALRANFKCRPWPVLAKQLNVGYCWFGSPEKPTV